MVSFTPGEHLRLPEWWDWKLLKSSRQRFRNAPDFPKCKNLFYPAPWLSNIPSECSWTCKTSSVRTESLFLFYIETQSICVKFKNNLTFLEMQLPCGRRIVVLYSLQNVIKRCSLFQTIMSVPLNSVWVAHTIQLYPSVFTTVTSPVILWRGTSIWLFH